MDGLSKLITERQSEALALVKSLLTNPILINVNPKQALPYSVSLECESYQQNGAAEVSESLVICKTNKVNVSDNVAPGSWSWELQGYIPGSKALEPTNYYTPIVKLNTEIIKHWFKKGAILIFKDGENSIHTRCVIQNLTISQQKDCRNKTPFSMTIKEINVMNDSYEEMTESQLKAGPAIGSYLNGVAAPGGTTTASVISKAAAAAAGLI